MTEFDNFQDRFSETASKILQDSEQIARSMNQLIDTEHLLIALTSTPGTIAYETLRNLAIYPEKILSAISKKASASQHMIVSEDIKRVLKTAYAKAAFYGSPSVDSEHLLLALAKNKDSHAYQLLLTLNVDPKHLASQLEEYFEQLQDGTFNNNLEGQEADEEIDPTDLSAFEQGSLETTTSAKSAPTKPKTATDYFTTDLTKQARLGKLDPVIGRTAELRRMIQILVRRVKNNPVLVGEPGVGKTAIVEGLAQKIASADVPKQLADKKVLSLDLALLISGTSYRGQFEDRVKKLVDEINKDGNIILFLDELHTIVGAGAAEGSMDLSNILKPALAKGQLRLIGATTSEEYRKHIERDPALERRLQKVQVEEPTVPDTIEILEGLKSAYEKHHNVTINREAIVAAAEMSKRYISDRFLPDKAIDLIDEAAAAAQLEEKQLKIYNKIIELEKRQRQYHNEHQQASENFDYARAAQFRVLELRVIDELDKLKSRLPKRTHSRTIDREDIAKVVSLWTGVPLNTLTKGEKVKLAEVDKILKNFIVGQDEAIDALSSVIKRSSAGVADPNRPLGSFIFLGPTGVGKTELAKVLAREVFGREEALIKIDMSEFMERHNVSRLVGAPPGYVGYEDAGKLTEAIRRQPYSVVLLDEIEKAHPDIFNMLLQIMEDGYLTDAKGRKVNFRNTIIVMTSNIGMSELNKQAAIGFKTKNGEEAQAYEELKNRVTDQLKEHFRPEFINRLDKIIVFRPLGLEQVKRIVQLQVDRLVERLLPEGIEIQIEDKAKELLAEKGFDAKYGARHVRRIITEYIEDPLSQMLLTGKLSKKAPIRVLRKGEKLALVK